MAAEAKKAPASAKIGADVANSGAKPPYPYRSIVAAVLLAGNFLVAAIYFGLLNI